MVSINRPRWPLALGVIGPLIWAAGGFLSQPGSAIVGAFGALVGITGAVAAHLLSGPYEFAFEASDWNADQTGDFYLTVPMSQHRRGRSASAKAEMRKRFGGYETVGVDTSTLPDGSIRLDANTTFAGRLLIQ